MKIIRSDENSFRAFYDEVDSRLLNSNMNPNLFCDPNEKYKQFDEMILSAKAKHLAPQIIKYKNHKQKLSQWMTSGILNSTKFRDKLYLKLQSLSPGTVLHNKIDLELRSYNNLLKKIIRQAKYSTILIKFTRTNQILDTPGLLLRKSWINVKIKKIFPHSVRLIGKILKTKSKSQIN